MELIIKEGVTEIKDFEYRDNKEITSIKFLSPVKKIGLSSFLHCSNLKVVDLPRGIEYIGVCAFGGCPAVIFVPNTIRRIDDTAFSSNSVIFFECDENDFIGYHQVRNISDYPDSYYRGSSMGDDTIEEFYYEEGCKLFFNKSHDEFLNYLKDKNI